MQIGKFLFGSIIFSLILMYSCKKSDNPVSGDGKYLSKIIYFYWNGTSKDTLVNIFNYDALKRVSECLEIYITRVNDIVVSKQFDTSMFHYIGTDVLPYKITKRSNNQAGILNQKSFFSYSNSGKILKDSNVVSFIHANGFTRYITTISTYTYENNHIYVYTTKSANQPDPNNYLRLDTITLDDNTNISEKHSAMIYETNPQDTNFYFSKYSYGSNPSPLLNMNICNKLGINESNYYFSILQGSKNNLTSSITDIYFNGILSLTDDRVNNLCTYSFQQNGYPDTLNLNYEGRSEIQRLVYQYISL